MNPFPLPSISDDTLYYSIHLPQGEDPAPRALLVTEYVQSLLPSPWLWNKDSWELKVDGDKLGGTMRVGDAVDDEWLVVWLLREVSKKWTDLVISIRDSDGEFLLIEAAEELPSWVSPDNAEGRLWMSAGNLHLIPLSIKVSEAIPAVRSSKYISTAIGKAIWQRIAHYPGRMRDHLHRAKAYVPTSIARALAVQPSLIQKAVEGFYVRDPAQLRAAARMTHFPPTDSVLTSILMTRASYAQLQGQTFHAPRVFGPEWTRTEDDNEARWRSLGVKIATGFEIMHREGGKSKGESVSTVGWEDFLVKLKLAGFFGDNVEGSKGWKEREERALQGWKELQSNDTAQFRPSFAQLVDAALKAPEVPLPDDPEDSTTWLEVSPDDLDAMLARAGATRSGEEAPKEDGIALQDLAKKVEAFVGGTGDMTGARFEDELSDDEDEDDDDEDDDEDEDGNREEDDIKDENDNDEEEDVPADPWDRLTPAEKEARMQGLVASLPAEEWGQKPVENNQPKEPSKEKAKETTDDAGASARGALFKQDFDGVDSDSDSDDDLPAAGSLGRHIAQMKWGDFPPVDGEGEATIVDDGDMDIDDKLDQKRDAKVKWDDNIDEEMRARVLGDIGQEDQPVIVEITDEAAEAMDVDQDVQENMDDFIAFARQTLGVGDEQWEQIVKSREARGAFVPTGKAAAKAAAPAKPITPIAEPTPPPPTAPTGASLDSFEKVMSAMEAELARKKGEEKSSAKGGKKGSSGPLPPLPTEADLEALSEDDLMQMDQELRAALKSAGIDDDDEDEDVQGLEGDEAREYRMMRDFLESYKSQEGGSGAIGNLFGRLGGK